MNTGYWILLGLLVLTTLAGCGGKDTTETTPAPKTNASAANPNLNSDVVKAWEDAKAAVPTK